MKVVLLLLLFPTAVIAQTQVSLRHKYGTPVAETFTVRPGIIVTASYFPNGEVREMTIAPQPPSGLIKSSGTTLDNELLREIVAELVPRKDRGAYIMVTLLNSLCLPKNDCAGSSEEFEKLIIYYNAREHGANYAVVQWKDRSSLGPQPKKLLQIRR